MNFRIAYKFIGIAFIALVNCGVAASEPIGAIPDNLSWAERMSLTLIKAHPEAWSMRKSDGEYRWAYTQGLVLTGMERLYKKNGDERLYHYIKGYADYHVREDGTIPSVAIDEYNIDSVSPGKLLFFLYEKTRDPRYLKAIKFQRSQLDWHPRTTEGGFWHKLKYPWQMWLDGLYMGEPFYAQYETTYGDPAKLTDVVNQFVLSESKTRDPKTGLLYHGWDESRVQRWANPETGLSPHFWSRALGWYAMALVDTLDFFPQDHPQRQTLIDIYTRLIDALLPYQHKSGLWYQVTIHGKREGNYLEASSSSMFAYAIAKGVRMGYLPEKYRAVADKTYDGLIRELVKVDKDGNVLLRSICRSAGLGGKPYRDGSYEYYISEPRDTNDAHGTGAFIIASVELGR
jgi:unsaturated rhamnogalacturonyl hydrolase